MSHPHKFVIPRDHYDFLYFTLRFYQQKLKEQQYSLNLLKLSNKSKDKTREFYLSQIDIVKNISKNVK